MKNYRDSDYALNKHSKGIVYKFVNQKIEISMEDYLAENPDKTKQDFLELKELSDGIFLEQDRTDHRTTRKNQSIHEAEDILGPGDLMLDEQYIEKQEYQYASQAIALLLNSDELTKTQRRRFIRHIFDGLSTREIAQVEGTSHIAVYKSIRKAIEKIEKNFLSEG